MRPFTPFILKRFIKDMAHQKLLVLLAFLMTLAQVGLTIYLPVLIGRAVDVVIKVKADYVLFPLLEQMGLVIALNTLIQWVNPLIYNQLIYRYSQELRNRVMEKVHQLPLSYLDKKGSGDLISRLTTDVEQLNNGLLMIFNQFFVGLLTIIATILTMAEIDWGMMLVVLILTPCSLLLARFIAKKSYRLFKKQTQARGIQTQLIEESLTQESLLQVFNAQEQFQNEFKTTNEIYASDSQAAIFYSSTVNPSTRFVNALIYAVVTGFGAFRILNGATFTVGQLVTFLNYVNQYTKPFNDISSVLSELQSALACADRLYRILDEKAISETVLKQVSALEVKGEIFFDGVQFAYEKDHPLIQHLTLRVPAGSKVAIVGPTGAGKSTLINLLMRFYPVDKGQIFLDGISITDYTRDSYRKQFGMVLQETWIKEGTIHENIAYARPSASKKEVIQAAKAANADFFIKQLPQGYDTYLQDAGESLSQGQRQLLAIARVFLAIPKILILDEATSSIDTRTEALIQQAFHKLMLGRTSFIIAHRLSTIQNADLILLMVDGAIVEQGTHDELMQQEGIYYQMQQTQE